MSARTVQLRLGHSSVTTTLGIYTAEFAAQDKEICRICKRSKKIL